MHDLTRAFIELIRLTSTDLPPDVEKAITAARENESRDSAARGALESILQNVTLARENSTPICQDTGTPIKNAKVKCKGVGRKNIETNASGYYELINLREGKWKLKIKAKDFKKGNARVEISSDGTYEHNFELRPKKKEQL